MNIFEVLIVQPLFNLLILLYSVIPGGDFGVSVIVFTILLRLVMYPLVKKQLHQTSLMRKLQPELTQIKKRYKGNRQMQSMQSMELYKRHGVSPFRSIGVMFIQLPVFIALYIVIRVFAMYRDELGRWTYDFLENIPTIKTIVEHPNSFNEKLFGIVDLTKHAFADGSFSVALIVIAVAAAIGQFVMSKQTMPTPTSNRGLREIMRDAAAGKEADQSDINSAIMGKMIYALPVFMLFVMLSLPGAIAVYYAVNTFVAIIQQHHILKEDEDDLIKIAQKQPKQEGKKATAKARARVAEEGTVTRIVAKGSTPSKPKSAKRKGGKS